MRLVLAFESDLERYVTGTAFTWSEVSGLNLMTVQPGTDVVHGRAKSFSGPLDPDDQRRALRHMRSSWPSGGSVSISRSASRAGVGDADDPAYLMSRVG